MSANQGRDNDDDAAMRQALVRLIESAGIEAASFSSAREYLDDRVHRQVDCTVTDMNAWLRWAQASGGDQ
jgi:FixJ family two-component response regulator